MSFLHICIFGIVAVFLALFFKTTKQEYSQYISLFVCIVILLISVRELKNVLSSVTELVNQTKDFVPFIIILVKMIGISYASEITIGICKDAGFSAIGEGIEIITRVVLCFLSLPVLKEVLLLITQNL